MKSGEHDIAPVALAAVFLTGTAGVMVTGIKPILVAAYVSSIHLTATQAGLLVGIDMAAAIVGNFLVTWRLYRSRRPIVAALALLTLGAGNLLSIASGSIGTLVLARVVTGTASGIAAGMMAATLTNLPSPDRRFGLYSVVTLSTAAFATWLSGKLLQTYGVAAMFSALAALALPPLVLSRWFPALRQPVEVRGAVEAAPAADRSGVALVLVGTVLYYCAAGGVWAFMGQIGISRGLDAAQVSRVLGVALLAGVLGALVPCVVRVPGRALPVTISTLITLASVAVVASGGVSTRFAIAVGCFMFAWIAYFPYLMGLCARFDPIGRLGASCLGAQNIGLTVGPIAAGFIAQSRGYSSLLAAGMICYALAAIAVLTAMYRAHTALPAPLSGNVQATSSA